MKFALTLNELFFHFWVFPIPKPTVIKAISVLFWSGSSCVFNIKTLDNASPYSAEYPPVENDIPLNKKGEKHNNNKISELSIYRPFQSYYIYIQKALHRTLILFSLVRKTILFF